MKPGELLESEIIKKSFGPGHRITKQVTALRKKNPAAFPAGRKGSAIEVSALEAANLILVLSSNPNPFNAIEFDNAVNSIQILKPFLNDLALIFNCGGTHLNGDGVECVLISLDRPSARIIFKSGAFNDYGWIKAAKAVERFAHITSDTIKEIAYLVNNSPRAGTEEERKNFLKQKQNENIQ